MGTAEAQPDERPGRGADRALPGLLLLYAAATLLHFAHNAEYLRQYPNLPAAWTRTEVFAAWGLLSGLGLSGYLIYRRGKGAIGLALLYLYAGLGFAGLLHYTRAPMEHHSAMMNATIWAEAAAATLLIGCLATLARAGQRPGSTGRGGHAP